MGVAKSRTRLSDFTFTFHFLFLETNFECVCLCTPTCHVWLPLDNAELSSGHRHWPTEVKILTLYIPVFVVVSLCVRESPQIVCAVSGSVTKQDPMMEGQAFPTASAAAPL